jgi:hypothetical protein
MEPTLMAVLAVSSLRKLELVGDHRQLPAYINQCWYSLAKQHSSLKVSLFERLLEQGQGRWELSQNASVRRVLGSIPPKNGACSVLDEQRRMRARLGDITRGEYADLVHITDHQDTITQFVGKKLMLKKDLPMCRHAPQSHDKNKRDPRQSPMSINEQQAKFQAHQKLWDQQSGVGRSIPGVSSCLYFWDLKDNKQSRPKVGLSACNEMEAVAVAQLVSYLYLCGIQPDCISIITPYTGQKREILSALKAEISLPINVRFALTVSTVDSYQGDENDVVILSLVRTTPGNQFVALANRFIVALSRARLGCFVIGASAAVRGNGASNQVGHWERFLSKLEKKKESWFIGTNARTEQRGWVCMENVEAEEVKVKNKEDDCEFVQSRIGQAFPICCPRHITSERSVHDLSANAHTHDAFPKHSNWGQFCSKPCPYELPHCKHPCGKKCHSPELAHSQKCVVAVPHPCPDHKDVPLTCHTVFPERIASSQHRSSAQSSSTLEQALRAFQCPEMVEYLRPECRHKEPLPCFRRKQVNMCLVKLPDCQVRVNDFKHPRCGHVLKSPICADKRLWESRPPSCKEQVVHTAGCGCKTTMACCTHIQELESPSLCTLSVEKPRPRCGHIVSMRCHVATEMKRQWQAQSGMSLSDDRVIKHGEHYGPSEKKFSSGFPECHQPVKYRRSCGHILKTSCAQAFLWAKEEDSLIPICEEEVPCDAPLCGHKSTMPCWAKDTILQVNAHWNLWRCTASTALPEERLKIQPKLGMDAKYEQVLQRICPKKTSVLRTCGSAGQEHVLEVECEKLYLMVQRDTKLPACQYQVTRGLTCGHDARVMCHTQNDKEPPCLMVVAEGFIYSCQMHSDRPGRCDKLRQLQQTNPPCPKLISCRRFRCRHEVKLPCHLRSAAEKPLMDGAQLDFSIEAPAIVDAKRHAWEVAIPPNVPACGERVSFRHLCGHVRHDIPCAEACSWLTTGTRDLTPLCEENVSFISPLCGHELVSQCHLIPELLKWTPWAAVPGGVNALSPSGVTEVIIKHLLSPKTLSKPLEKALVCSLSMKLIRLCGHTQEMTCAKVLHIRQVHTCCVCFRFIDMITDEHCSVFMILLLWL